MLEHQRFLFIDCQTTGMHPSHGELLEIAWCLTSAADLATGAEPIIFSSLIEIEGSMPWRVAEITGLKTADFALARPLAEVRDQFLKFLAESSVAGAPLWSVIHYAQFERAFLEQFLFGDSASTASDAAGFADDAGIRRDLPFQILCTHMIAKRLFPQAPSRNIRALSGFLGSHIGEVKRAREHVQATLEIWKGLQSEISSLPVANADELLAWSKSSTTKRVKTSKASYEYRVDRDKRLSLPASPGIYRMLSKTGRILYVGKATCLKDRVNSYFRGKRGRDARKLEMMAQTWDIQITVCQSALEAAVLESDEIKKHDPPYNVSLKNGRRRLLFYDHDFGSSLPTQDATHIFGPFRAMNPVEDLKQVLDWQRFGPGVVGGGGHLFYGLYEDDIVQAGYALFLAEHPLLASLTTVRSHLAYAFGLWRAQTDDDGVDDVDNVDSPEDIDEDITPEEMAQKFVRIYLRAAQAMLRTRMINRLMNSRVKWRENDKDFEIAVSGGHITDASAIIDRKKRIEWSSLGVADYDRMSVLASELSARRGQISFV